MTVTTQGLALNSGPRAWRAAIELLSSMRFAIALLTLICIASVMGTVLKQQEPWNNYVNQFGPFWADVFARAGLYRVYSAWWFLLILAVLVLSTSLCVIRSTPKIVADLRSFKESIRTQSLKSFGQHAQQSLDESSEAAAQRIGQVLRRLGWRVRLQHRDSSQGGGWMVAARNGGANKLGYIAAHSAIVLICVGGLLDGDLMVRAQMLFRGKQVYQGGGMVADVPAQYRLPEGNPTFRGNLWVAEGGQSGTAVINQSNGVVLQELPFSVELKKFIVEYYSTGMPKLFASDIVIHDKETGQVTEARTEVNHPATYRGVEIFQSSFEDGGSQLQLHAYPLGDVGAGFTLHGVVGGSSPVAKLPGAQGGPWTVEYTGLRVINVENLAEVGASGVASPKADVRAVLQAQLGAANKSKESKDLHNVGPSMSYKLRDSAGQAREYNNYMLPVDMGDGVPVFLLGMREDPADNFRYLRVPADAAGTMDDFMRLSQALRNPGMREKALARYANKAVDGSKPQLVAQLKASAGQALSLFAGDASDPTLPTVAGLQAISDFIEGHVPQTEQNKAGEVLVRILNGVLFELMQLSREQAGLPPIASDGRGQAFMTQAVLTLSDIPLYPSPFVLMLTDFKQVQASVFQVARAPGKLVVYAGCALLILGVCAMLYVRERRVWVWLEPASDGLGSQATMAYSTNRKTLESDNEFLRLKLRLLLQRG